MLIKVFNEDGKKLFQYKSNIVPQKGERIVFEQLGATVLTVSHDVRIDEIMPNRTELNCIEIEVNVD